MRWIFFYMDLTNNKMKREIKNTNNYIISEILACCCLGLRRCCRM